MSNKKLKCSNCKKSKLPSEYSKRQAGFGASKRECKICIKEKCTESLQNSQFTAGKRKIDMELNESIIRMDGDAWKLDEKKQEEKEEKRKNLLTPLSKNKNNYDSHKTNYFHGDNSIPFYSTIDKEKKMRNVRDALREACNKVLDNIDDTDLLDAAKSRYCF